MGLVLVVELVLQEAEVPRRAKAATADRRRVALGVTPFRLVLDPDAVRDPRHVVEVADTWIASEIAASKPP
jgi:hypothetical protein